MSSIQIPSLHLYLVYFILLIIIQLFVKKEGTFHFVYATKMASVRFYIGS